MTRLKVVANNNIEAPEISRQAAYTARNKANIIKKAQETLEEIGPSATIEQIAAHAEVSPTTIYKYFESKDQLFVEALSQMWHEWVGWAFTQSSTKEPFEAVIESSRRLFRVKQTHPHFAQVLHNTLREMPDFIFLADGGVGKMVLSRIASSDKIKSEDFEQRFVIWSNILAGLVHSVIVTENFSPDEADIALGIGLSVWGISEAKAKKLVSRAL